MNNSVEPKAVRELQAEKLKVKVYADRKAMGLAAALVMAAKLKDVLVERGTVNVVFAAAQSQVDFLAALAEQPGIDWSKVVALHMDEYHTLPADAPQRFGLWLKRHFFDVVKPGKVLYMSEKEEDGAAVCARYTAWLKEYPVDITCIGVGENGHVAFNDPPVADFNDAELVKVVVLDKYSRQQQVNDGEFASFDRVPTEAITLTVPALMASAWIIGTVPGVRKSEAVKKMLRDEISEACPATILRRHDQVCLYLDADAAKLI